jgi:GNAT superfamily N-acetyltransferase
VEKWIKYSEGDVEADYKDLSIEDRFLNGGPWMSIETCSVHLNNLLVNDQHPLIALYDGRTVGELELYVGEEKGILGKNAYIDILVVHRDYRGLGIGRELVEYSINLGRELGCETISVWPDKKAVNFYRKCGFNESAFDIVNIALEPYYIEISQPLEYTIVEFPTRYEKLMNMEFISPRIMSSFAAWLKSRWSYALKIDYFRFDGFIRELEAAYIIESSLKKGEASLYLWIRNKENLKNAIHAILRIAKEYGIKKLYIILDKKVLKEHLQIFPYKVVGEERHLMLRLK